MIGIDKLCWKLMFYAEYRMLHLCELFFSSLHSAWVSYRLHLGDLQRSISCPIGWSHFAPITTFFWYCLLTISVTRIPHETETVAFPLRLGSYLDMALQWEKTGRASHQEWNNTLTGIPTRSWLHGRFWWTLVNLFQISKDSCLAIGFHFGPTRSHPPVWKVCECPSVYIFCRRKETAFAMAKAAEVLRKGNVSTVHCHFRVSS